MAARSHLGCLVYIRYINALLAVHPAALSLSPPVLRP